MHWKLAWKNRLVWRCACTFRTIVNRLKKNLCADTVAQKLESKEHKMTAEQSRITCNNFVPFHRVCAWHIRMIDACCGASGVSNCAWAALQSTLAPFRRTVSRHKSRHLSSILSMTYNNLSAAINAIPHGTQYCSLWLSCTTP